MAIPMPERGPVLMMCSAGNADGHGHVADGHGWICTISRRCLEFQLPQRHAVCVCVCVLLILSGQYPGYNASAYGYSDPYGRQLSTIFRYL